jgi:reactive chlorine resistance protein C
MQAKQTRQMGMSESALLRARTVWEDRRVHNLTISGLWVLRYGLVFFLLMFGAFKFFAFEAEGIRPLVANSPVLAWLYTILGVRGTSSLFGVLEVTTGLLIALRRWFPRASGYGSLAASGIFVITLSFLFTTPGALSPFSPVNGFLLKDIMLFGAALSTGAEALRAEGRSTR